jgi:molecular chaperone HtpG
MSFLSRIHNAVPEFNCSSFASSENGKQTTDNSKDINKLIELFKKELGEKVKDVVTTEKLESSPVCLAVGAGDMDIRMERFLREQKQLPHKTAKILEINPNHPLIKALATKGETEEVRDTINLLFDQALILEGENVEDLKSFSSRLNKLLEKSFAA